jgi:integrase
LAIIALDKERANKPERLSTRTVQRHLTALSTLWADAISRDYVAANLFSGFKFSRQARAQDQRDMWESADLVRLFATPVWSGCQSPHRRSAPGPLIIRDEKFWLPLIAVFSGLRQEEICQLQVSDVKCEQGIWYFDVNDEPPRKLKNRTAVRLVPIHSELVRIGFLGHVEEQRKNNQVRVFSGLKPWGCRRAPRPWLHEVVFALPPGKCIYRPGLDFHSFRHSTTTFMHRAGVMDSIIDRVTGHATPGETSRYTKGSDLRRDRAGAPSQDQRSNNPPAVLGVT